MKFKYISDYNKLIGLSTQGECRICNHNTSCFNEVCYRCYQEQESLKNCPEEFRDLYTVARPDEIRKQLKLINPDWNDEKIDQIARKRDHEIEHGTPLINGYQSFQWPCIDGDYAEFIAYGCKPFYNTISKDGKKAFETSVHEEVKDCLYEEYWEERVPDEVIHSSNDTNYATLFFVFKSLHSDKIVTYIDSM